MIVCKYPCSEAWGELHCVWEPVARCIRIRLQVLLLLTPPPHFSMHSPGTAQTARLSASHVCTPPMVGWYWESGCCRFAGITVSVSMFMQQLAVLSLAMHYECVAAAAVAPEFVHACIVLVSCQETGGGCTRACTRPVIGTPVRGIPPSLIIPLPPATLGHNSTHTLLTHTLTHSHIPQE